MSATPTLYDRLPPTPLLGQTGAVRGWLHPDNADMLPGSGCGIELAVLSRCQTPTVDTIFGQDTRRDNDDGGGGGRLLWVLAIMGEDGVAERRGVGQVYEEALGDGVELPVFKTILLG